MQIATKSTDYTLLMDYLYEVKHSNVEPLANVDLLHIVKDTFREFVVFLGDKFTLSQFYYLFRDYFYVLTDRLGHERWQADIVLLSWEMGQYVKASGVALR